MRSILNGCAITVALHLGVVFADAQISDVWTDVTVEVLADQPVTQAYNLTKQRDGFQRLAIIDYIVFRVAIDEDGKVSKEKVKRSGSMTKNGAQMWADLNKLYGTARLNSDNLMTLCPERQSLVKEVFRYPAMDETIPLHFWNHASRKGDGFELLLGRRGNDSYLGVFNWSDIPKDYALATLGKPPAGQVGRRNSAI